MSDITITGKIDCYDMKNGVIYDYKTASVWKVIKGDFEDWYRQGMIYAWLLTKNGFKAEKCRFITLLKDHSKTDAARNHNYPQKPTYIYEFSVTPQDLAEIERFILDKTEEYLTYRNVSEDLIPPCSAKERWETKSEYAVKKAGQKRAVRVFDNLEDAENKAVELGKGYSVEVRKGVSKRCAGYCLCKDFCNFYQENVKPTETASEQAEEQKTGEDAA